MKSSTKKSTIKMQALCSTAVLLAVSKLTIAQTPTAPSGDGDSEFVEASVKRMAAARLPAGVHVEKDVAYGPDAAQRLDVYLPSQAHSAPVVFMVHGGAWMLGDKAAASVLDNKLAHWLPQGIAFVSINYRMSSSPKVLDQVQDVASAMALVQTRAAAWGLDANRLRGMGHSAGAHLVSLLSSDPALAAAHGVRLWLGTVSLDSAALDVPQLMQRRRFRFYDRVFGSDPSYWASTSPVTRLHSAPAVPMMMVCSTRRSDSCPSAQAFVAKANDLGAKASVLPVDLSHAEVNGNLGLDGEYTRAVDDLARKVRHPDPAGKRVGTNFSGNPRFFDFLP